MERITSIYHTSVNKYIFPIVLIFGMMNSIIFLLNPKYIILDIGSKELGLLALLIFATGSFISLRLALKLKYVEIENSNLKVSDWNQNEIISASNVDDVKETYLFMFQVYVITIRLKTNSIFGREICFLPKGAGPILFSKKRKIILERINDLITNSYSKY